MQVRYSDITSVQVHPDESEVLKKKETICWKKLRMIDNKGSYDYHGCWKSNIFFAFFWQQHDAAGGEDLLIKLGEVEEVTILMDRTCEGDKTRAIVTEFGYTPVVPSKSNRLNPRDYDKEHCNVRNLIELCFEG